ncbi:CPBP family intramembrane metalloprotease [Clostridium sp. WB02_MRS01]|nr:CPBP family intramembrane metalloprotease [Clostridium sp. WB02_MRS01]
MIHNRLETKYSLTATCIITAVIWALFHNLWYTYLYVIPIGIVISFVYTKRKNILFPIAIHIGNNLFNLIGRAFGWYGLINQKAVGVGFIMIVIGIVVFCMQITKEEIRL